MANTLSAFELLNEPPFAVGTTVELVCDVLGNVVGSEGTRVPENMRQGTQVVISNVQRRPWVSTATGEATPPAMRTVGVDTRDYDIIYELKLFRPDRTWYNPIKNPRARKPGKGPPRVSHLALSEDGVNGLFVRDRQWENGEQAILNQSCTCHDHGQKVALFAGDVVFIRSGPESDDLGTPLTKVTPAILGAKGRAYYRFEKGKRITVPYAWTANHYHPASVFRAVT